MSIDAIGAIGKEVAKVDASNMMQTTQLAPTNSPAADATLGSGINIPASEVTRPENATGTSFPGFSSEVMNGVYGEIDKLGSKLPKIDAANNSPIDAFKAELSPTSEAISGMVDKGVKDPKMEAVTALSKTFDHAVFMAMVNQVISGVSDTSRTLIKQA